MILAFTERRNYIVKRLNSIEGISCLMPEGAFYTFPDISRFLGKKHEGRPIKDSFSLAELLLEKAKVAVVPGRAFGADGHLRISYATSMEEIAEGMDRIEEFFREITA